MNESSIFILRSLKLVNYLDRTTYSKKKRNRFLANQPCFKSLAATHKYVACNSLYIGLLSSRGPPRVPDGFSISLAFVNRQESGSDKRTTMSSKDGREWWSGCLKRHSVRYQQPFHIMHTSTESSESKQDENKQVEEPDGDLR